MEDNEDVRVSGDEISRTVTKGSQDNVDRYVGLLSKLLHSPDTRDMVSQMLAQGDPMMTIPETALTVNDQAEMMYKQNGQKPDLDTLAAGSQFLINDLVEIGNAGGLFNLDLSDDELSMKLLKDTMQPYIQKGLKDGSIDPVELQKKVEPLMKEAGNYDQGMMLAEQGGIPSGPTSDTAAESYRRQGIMTERNKAKKNVVQEKKKEVVKEAV